MTTLIKGGRLIDPATETDKVMDIIIKDGIVAERGESLSGDMADEVISADGCYVMPGLIDLHVHLREISTWKAPLEWAVYLLSSFQITKYNRQIRLD